jgi:4-aminobutyrate aminotransferase-like enzyme
MSRKIKRIPESELKRYYEDAATYLLKPWQTRADMYGERIITGGEGKYFHDARGKEYLDFLSQLFNVNLGLGDRRVVEAIKRQADELTYTKDTFLSIPQILLAKRLSEATGMGPVKTFFSNSGTEANEAAFKIARVYTGRFKVMGVWNAYHGSTFASMSAGGVAANRSPFEPLVPGFFHVPPPYCYRCPFGLEYPDCGTRCARFLEESIRFHDPGTVAAFIADPVFVSGGILVPTDEYWPMVREICDRNNVVLILDEVIAGFGRTGKLFAYEHWGIKPDILTLAKAISNAAVPLGATVMNKKISDFFLERKSFMHGYTYSGHPLACAAGLAAVNAYIEDKMPENAARVGRYLLDALKGVQDRHRSVGDVRGLGLIEGVEFVRDKRTKEPLVAKDPNAPMEERPLVALCDGCMDDGLLMMPTMAGSTLRIAPPLIIDEDDVDKAMEIFDKHVAKVEKRFL